jgi:hypothetical protein
MSIAQVIVDKLPKSCMDCELKDDIQSGWGWDGDPNHCFASCVLGDINHHWLESQPSRPDKCPLVTIERTEEILEEWGIPGYILYLFGKAWNNEKDT